MDGFTLTGLAFPVAPANLTGFTIQGCQWVGGPAPSPNVNRVVFTGTVVTRRVVTGGVVTRQVSTGSVCTRRVFED